MTTGLKNMYLFLDFWCVHFFFFEKKTTHTQPPKHKLKSRKATTAKENKPPASQITKQKIHPKAKTLVTEPVSKGMINVLFIQCNYLKWNIILLASNPEPGKFWLSVKLIQSQSDEQV